MNKARNAGLAVAAFNIPYLPMMEPVIQAIVDEDCFALIEVARIEWKKFESKNLRAVYKEFSKWKRSDYVHLHLDHVPVIDEDNQQVDYHSIIEEAIDLGYQSVMVDGSRLNLEENIKATRSAVNIAHQAGIACEAELGAVLGHEEGPLPPYEQIFSSGRGFTRVDEAKKFVDETGCDWLSVAIGNIHGSVSVAERDKKKIQARLNLDHLQQLNDALQIPLVLHGGSGIQQDFLLGAFKRGISKINIATEIRQPYEAVIKKSGNILEAQLAIYQKTSSLLKDFLLFSGTRKVIIS